MNTKVKRLTDAHDLIIAAAGLKERSIPKEMGWIKVEYTSNNLLNIEIFDDDEQQEAIREFLENYND